MTITLIIILIYLFVWAYQKISKQISIEDENRKNKTNPKLQAKIREDIQLKITKEWEALNVSMFSNTEKLNFLYKKYNIPLKSELQNTTLQDRFKEDSLSELIRAITMRTMHKLGYKYHYGNSISAPSIKEKLCNKNPLKEKYPWL